MIDFSETSPVKVVADRRRPGRVVQVNPHLLPLLRGSSPSTIPDSSDLFAIEDPEEDAFASAKGIALGMVLSVPLWAIIGAALWAALR